MNIVKKDIDQLNAIITIEIAKPDYEGNVEKTLRDYRKKANIPGFRPGMVPLNLVKKMYGKAVLGEEINKILSEKLYDYIKENDLNILGEPLPNETEQKEINFDTDETFEFAFDIALAPAFDVNISGKVAYYDIDVTDKMIEDRISAYAERFGQYSQVDDVEEGDVLKGDVVELENGQPKEGGIQATDTTVSPLYMKDEAQKKLFVGQKKGAKVVFNPQTAFGSDAEIRSLLKLGKDSQIPAADFQFEIKTITRYTKSEINQELFDKVYGAGNVADEADFRTKVSADIKEDMAQNSAYKFGLDAKEMIMKQLENLAFPDAFLKRWILAAHKDITEESLATDYPKMLDELKWHLAKEKIAKENKLEVEPAEVENYAKQMAKMQFSQYGLTGIDDSILDNYAKDMMKKEDQLKGLIERVLENKVFDTIKKTAKLDTKKISIDDFNKLFETK